MRKGLQALRSNRRRNMYLRLVERDGKVCWYCGKKLVIASIDLHENVQPDLDPRPIATIDHLKPVSMGGSNHISNLILSCRPCHNERHN